MLNSRIALGVLLLAMAVCGCRPPSAGTSASRSAKLDTQPADAGNMWVAANDGSLSLRLSVATRRLKAHESIQVAAEIRNNSQQKITVLRPFGDNYAARAVGMKIWDEHQQIRYTGPVASYVIGAAAFAVIGPGETVQDRIELTIDNFAGMEPAGTYTLRYDYSYSGEWDTTAAAGASGIRDAWRGAICSREVEFVRQ